MLNGANVLRPHDWGSPLPGQGSTKVCKRCGTRNYGGNDDEQCSGQNPDTVAETRHMYDPYED